MSKSIKYFIGIIKDPQKTLKKLPSDSFLFLGFFMFIFEELLYGIKSLFTDIYDLAYSSGDSALIARLADMSPEEVLLMNAEVYRHMLTMFINRMIFSFILFFLMGAILKIVLKFFKTNPTYVKILNIIGFAFVPQFLFVILAFLASRFSFYNDFYFLFRFLSIITAIYTYALIFTGLFLDKKEKV